MLLPCMNQGRSYWVLTSRIEIIELVGPAHHIPNTQHDHKRWLGHYASMEVVLGCLWPSHVRGLLGGFIIVGQAYSVRLWVSVQGGGGSQTKSVTMCGPCPKFYTLLKDRNVWKKYTLFKNFSWWIFWKIPFSMIDIFEIPFTRSD